MRDIGAYSSKGEGKGDPPALKATIKVPQTPKKQRQIPPLPPLLSTTRIHPLATKVSLPRPLTCRQVCGGSSLLFSFWPAFFNIFSHSIQYGYGYGHSHTLPQKYSTVRVRQNQSTVIFGKPVSLVLFGKLRNSNIRKGFSAIKVDFRTLVSKFGTYIIQFLSEITKPKFVSFWRL